MDTATPIALVDQLQTDLESVEAFRARHLALGVSTAKMDRAALEMLGDDLDIRVSTEGRLLDYVTETARAAGQKATRAFEHVAAWFDRTGAKELKLLREHVQQVQTRGSTPTTKTIPDRKLADELQVDGTLVTDHATHLRKLVEFGQTVTDHYAPNLLEFMGHIYGDVETSAYMRSYDEDDLAAMLDLVVHRLASTPDPALKALPLAEVKSVGGRQLFVKVPAAPASPFSKRLTGQEAKAVIAGWQARPVGLGSYALIKRTQGAARVGVVPVLELGEMLALIDELAVLADQVDRAAKIFKDVRRQERALSCVGFFNSIDEITEYTLDPATEGGGTVEVQTLDTVDRAKIELINAYLSDPVLSASQVVIRLSQQFLAVRRAYVQYIRTSLKFYR
jgi:hypothetical protein